MSAALSEVAHRCDWVIADENSNVHLPVSSSAFRPSSSRAWVSTRRAVRTCTDSPPREWCFRPSARSATFAWTNSRRSSTTAGPGGSAVRRLVSAPACRGSGRSSPRDLAPARIHTRARA